MPSPAGNSIKVYDIERTLCDMVKARHRADIQVINQAMKTYTSSKEKDIAKLMGYADQLRVKPKILKVYGSTIVITKNPMQRKAFIKKMAAEKNLLSTACHAELYDGTTTGTSISFEIHRELYPERWFPDCRHGWP